MVNEVLKRAQEHDTRGEFPIRLATSVVQTYLDCNGIMSDNHKKVVIMRDVFKKYIS